MKVPFRLYVISDRRRMRHDPLETLAELARAGLPALQWREKDLSPAENLRWLRAIAEQGATAPGFPLFINDRIDLALMARCHVHLTESSVPTECARRIAPEGMWVGRSTHSIEGARAAEQAGADFITFGPVSDTPSKREFGPPLGCEALREVCAAVRLPVFALGGIALDRIGECLEAGAWGVAMIRAIWDAPDPVRALEQALRSLPPQEASGR